MNKFNFVKDLKTHIKENFSSPEKECKIKVDSNNPNRNSKRVYLVCTGCSSFRVLVSKF